MLPVVKELLTNVVVKYVKHMVPEWKIAGATEFNAALRAGHGQALEDVPLSHDDTAFLQYTGGTTGVAKGAVLTHGNLVANVQQMTAWIARDLVDGKEVFVCPLPLYHVYALTSQSRVHEDRRTHRPGDQSARHAGLHPRPQASTPSRSSSASIRCTGRCSMRPNSRTWTRAA